MKKPLFLILKKRWFDLIQSGKKTTEFRSYNTYWCKRLLKGQDTLKDFTTVLFQLGYRRDAPKMMFFIASIEVEDHICHGWSFAIRLGTPIA